MGQGYAVMGVRHADKRCRIPGHVSSRTQPWICTCRRVGFQFAMRFVVHAHAAMAPCTWHIVQLTMWHDLMRLQACRNARRQLQFQPEVCAWVLARSTWPDARDGILDGCIVGMSKVAALAQLSHRFDAALTQNVRGLG